MRYSYILSSCSIFTYLALMLFFLHKEGKCYRAVFATIWFFSSVDSSVLFVVSLIFGFIVTVTAAPILFSMNLFMFGEVILMCKILFLHFGWLHTYCLRVRWVFLWSLNCDLNVKLWLQSGHFFMSPIWA